MRHFLCTLKQKLAANAHRIVALLFFLLIIGIILLADSGQKNLLFTFIKATHHADKVGHFLLYGVFTALLNRAFEFRGLRWGKYTLQWGAICVVAFTLLEELSQSFFPSRTVDIKDVIADMLGISVFTYFSLKWHQRNR
jgi:hypothetical protein